MAHHASSWSIARACLVLVLWFAATAIAHAECPSGKWDLTGVWTLDQTNGYAVKLTVQQVGDQISGGAFYNFPWGDGSVGYEQGTIEGFVSGNKLSFNIHWKRIGSIGEYTGSISPQGWLDGRTRDRLHAENTANWSSNYRPARCKQAAAPAPATPANPLDRFGDVKLPRGGADVLTKVTPPPTQPASQTAITKDEVDIYQGPDGSFQVLGWIEANKQAAVLAHKNDWYQLNFNGVAGVHWNKPGQTSGWIAYDHLNVVP